MMTYLATMFRYTAWADLRTLAALRAAPAAHAEAVPLLAHLLAAEHIWLSRLEHRDPRHPVWPTLSLDECDALAAENASGYRDVVGRLGEQQLDEEIRYRTSQGQEWVTPILDILTQVITHGPYHRGQIARVIGRSGGVAVNTDFITFAREAPDA
ncbi:DinB family protein [Aquisphaera insulae]|uniref:DinB family protein n=1 Tax=Aquisphaera insulae TaxID=2712864 RepID=UPI0013EE1F4B|nr:DinB family protein [Aquisphaera insulae]